MVIFVTSSFPFYYLAKKPIFVWGSETTIAATLTMDKMDNRGPQTFVLGSHDYNIIESTLLWTTKTEWEKGQQKYTLHGHNLGHEQPGHMGSWKNWLCVATFFCPYLYVIKQLLNTLHFHTPERSCKICYGNIDHAKRKSPRTYKPIMMVNMLSLFHCLPLRTKRDFGQRGKLACIVPVATMLLKH